MQLLTRRLSLLAHGLCFTSASAVVLYPSEVSRAEPDPYTFTVADDLKLNDSQISVARGIERRMRSHGFSDNLIMGAIVNAYAESKLDPNAVGAAGELGVFQLNPKGLGSKMKPHEMKDVINSTDRIIGAVKKNRKMMSLEKKNASATDHVMAFCTEIERPSNKKRKAKHRVKIMKDIVKKNS